jgi:hypothetical protein
MTLCRAAALLPVGLAVLLLSGCAGSREPALTAERFSNTVWQEVCPGADPASAYLRFLPDGTFAWSTAGLNPGDFQHDGDDRWGVAGEALVVSWDGEAGVTQYRESPDPDVLTGTSSRACGATARLERVE